MDTALIEEPPGSLEALQTLQHRAAGEMLFLEGEEPAGVYVLHCGEVDLLFGARNGEVKPLRIANPVQILGLSAVVRGRTHDSSATARTGCEVGFIERDEFLRRLEENRAFRFKVLCLLSSDVSSVYQDMRTLAAG
jgi:CRP-like cAMP-binding protein